MKVDAHQHFWAIKRGDYGWLTPDLAPIYRDFGPSDLRPLLDAAGIDSTILVQAAPTRAETVYLLDLAARHDWVAGVVGWTDFEAEDAVGEIRALAKLPKLVGLRPMLQNIADTGWILRADVQPALSAIAEAGLVLDALVQPRHLGNLAALAERHPGLAIVVDHAAKPSIASGEIATWARDMRKLALATPAFCKLSGLVTEAGEDWSIAKLRPYVDVLLDSFGPRRLIWGSDWPVLELAADYQRWFDVAGELLVGLGEEERAAIFGHNAQATYGI